MVQVPSKVTYVRCCVLVLGTNKMTTSDHLCRETIESPIRCHFTHCTQVDRSWEEIQPIARERVTYIEDLKSLNEQCHPRDLPLEGDPKNHNEAPLEKSIRGNLITLNQVS